MKELRSKIWEALISALPITVIVYIMALLPMAFDSGGVTTGPITVPFIMALGLIVAFFGIAIHAEKEILMIVVEKASRDGILNALYKEMGMDKKAQGIAFSLPVSDAARLVKLSEENSEEK